MRLIYWYSAECLAHVVDTVARILSRRAVQLPLIFSNSCSVFVIQVRQPWQVRHTPAPLITDTSDSRSVCGLVIRQTETAPDTRQDT